LLERTGILNYEEMKILDKALVISLGIDVDKIKSKINEIEENIVETATRKQIALYGMVARRNLKNCGNVEITDEEFGKYIIELFKLYSPDKIENVMKIK